MDSDWDFCEDVNELRFRYTNEFHGIMLWTGFVAAGCLIFVLLGSTNFDTWLVKTFDLTGLIIGTVSALILSAGLICSSYFLAVKLTDRNGTALFYDDYVEIIMEGKWTRIYYLEILQMKYVNYTSGRLIHNHYKLKIKCRGTKISIRSSTKELFELKMKDKKLFSRKQYRLSLRNVFDKIYFNIASKNEPE